jgi:hypothetical protein
MASFLSPEWFDLQLELLGALPKQKGVNLELQMSVEATPDGTVMVHQVVTDGRLTAAGIGAADDAVTELTVQYDDAVAVAKGEVDPHVRYMQGRIKLKGSMPPLLLHLRPVTASEAFATAWGDLVGRTDFA